jgi:hypothetical protein
MSTPNGLPKQIIQVVASTAQASGWFQAVETFEPKSAPTADIHFCTWATDVKPIDSSSIVSTSLRIELAGRIHINMLRDPIGDIDSDIMAAGWDMFLLFSAGFTLGGIVREVDLLGSEGDPLSLRFGYVPIDKRLFRVADFTIPIIVSDAFDQGS